MTKTPLVSVIVPAYNAEAYIGEAIESAFAQTWPELEVIVVDDGSTDSTQQVLRDFGDRIKLISKVNGGCASARNAGLEHATGEFIALLDADDVWLPEKLSLQIQILQQYPDIALIGSGCHEIDATGKIIGQVRHQIYKNPAWFSRDPPILDVSDINQNVLRNCVGAPSGVIFHRYCLEQVGYFDQSLNSSEDWDFYMRVVQKFKVAVYADTLIKYRILPGGLCSPSNTEQMLKTDLVVLRKIFGPLNAQVSWLQRRKAYGIRYFNHARAFMQNRQLSRARTIFLKAVTNWPGLLFSKPALFMLTAIIMGEEWLTKRQTEDARA